MKKPANDDEPLTFIQLGVAAALVVDRMRNAQTLRELQPDEPENTKSDAEQNGDPATKRDNETKRADMERRIRDLLRMEDALRRKRI